MLITVIFLISCIAVARLLEKHKLRVASVTYSVLFVVLLAALLLTADLEPVSRALSNLMGVEKYILTRDALVYALHSAGYGTCIYVALFLTLALQVTVSLAYAVVTVVTLFKKGRDALISKKDKYRRSRTSRALYLDKHINLLYCRMLN